MDKEYIEREAVKEHIKSYAGMFTNELGFAVSLEAVIRGIEFQPTADVVEVVRCGECIHSKDRNKIKDSVICTKYNSYKDINGFCEAGEKKKDGE